MALVQLHQKFPDGHTEMKSQGEINDYGDLKELMDMTLAEFSLPDEAEWIILEDTSRHWCVVEQTEKMKEGV